MLCMNFVQLGLTQSIHQMQIFTLVSEICGRKIYKTLFIFELQSVNCIYPLTVQTNKQAKIANHIQYIRRHLTLTYSNRIQDGFMVLVFKVLLFCVVYYTTIVYLSAIVCSWQDVPLGHYLSILSTESLSQWVCQSKGTLLST